MTTFKNYESIHYFMYPDEALKSWIDESHYTDHYKDSWDALMPVVEKIGVIGSTGGLFHDINLKRVEVFKSVSVFSPIDSVYACVIEFIQWYNEQTKSN